MQEIDSLLQTVMFTIYGNQYESREEHLLLTMFQVSLLLFNTKIRWSLHVNLMIPWSLQIYSDKTLQCRE